MQQKLYVLGLSLWVEESSESFCTNHVHYECISTQEICQDLCTDSSSCVGISYSHMPKTNNSCHLCLDDEVESSDDGYSFYKKPGTLQIYLHQHQANITAIIDQVSLY